MIGRGVLADHSWLIRRQDGHSRQAPQLARAYDPRVFAGFKLACRGRCLRQGHACMHACKDGWREGGRQGEREGGRETGREGGAHTRPLINGHVLRKYQVIQYGTRGSGVCCMVQMHCTCYGP
jgi:hypothetical protein